MRHLVVGAGEVGTAVGEVLDGAGMPVEIRDLEPSGGSADVLHVCFPYTADFQSAVKGYMDEHDAALVVVHSTVPVGTCDPHGWVHSPVTGRHPYLADSIRTFTKHFGGRQADTAADMFKQAGVAVAAYPRAIDTEAGKLWELVQFGLQVRVCQQIYDWCQRHGCDPEVVYRAFADSYNAGYAALGEPQLVRPVLEHVPGPIGGHCVTQCSGMLDHWLAELVICGEPHQPVGGGQ